MDVSTVNKPLLDSSASNKKKGTWCYNWNLMTMILFLCVSIYCMCYSYHSYCTKLQNMGIGLFPNGVSVKEITKFMFSPRDQGTGWCKGVLWRIFMFYTYFILCSFVGLLNCIPSVKEALNRNSKLPFCRTKRNVLLGSFLWILMICWPLTIIMIDLYKVNPFASKSRFAFWGYKLTSYWLNLTWTIAIAFCTRNTIFQHIYQQNYAMLISTHRFFGTFSFWMTFTHFLFACANWYHDHKANYWSFLWGKLTHYAWAEYHWADIHFMNLGYMIATDWLLKIVVIIFIAFLAAIPVVRRKAWEVFYYLHVFVLIAFLYLMVFHSSNIIYYAFIPLSLYIIDKLTRWISIYTRVATASIQDYDGVVRMDVTIQSKYGFPQLVGAVAYINVPKVSSIEYHPMSIAHNEGNHFYFYIKVTGNKSSWTHKLAALSGRKDVPVYIEGPYVMERRNLEASAESKKKSLEEEYNKNIVIVGGGCGFAGVSGNLKDSMRLVKSLPAEEQTKYSIHVVLVVQHHAHIDGMKELLVECQKYDFCHVYLFSTYSQDKQLKISSPKGKNANKLEVTSDIEEKEILEFTVDRPNLDEILSELNDEPISAFFCGPKPLCSSFLKALNQQKRPFSFHPDVFDM